MSNRLGGVGAALVGAVVALAGCGGSSTTPGNGTGTTTIAIASGNAQTGTVAQALAQPIIVKATASGVAVPNATVTFAVTAGGGTLSATSVTTDATGQAQATWTLGTKAGSATNTVTATLKGSSVAGLVFTAIAKAGPATTAKIDSTTNNQRGVSGQLLSKQVGAIVSDQYGNGVSGTNVTWTVTAGGGSVLPATSATDTTGRAVTSWTLGPSNGTQTITAAVSGLTVSGLVATATAVDIAISSITPDTLSAGTVATITGHGFTTDPTQNIVTIGGTAVVASAATATSVTFTVPSGACAPAGPTAVSLSSGGAVPPSVSKVFQPGQSINLAVGQQQIISDPTKFCLNFAATGATESYLVGVTNTKDDATNLQPALISIATSSGTSSLIAAAASKVSYSPAPSFLQSALSASLAVNSGDWSPQSRRLRLHREAMFQFRQHEMASVSGLRSLRTSTGTSTGVGQTTSSTGSVSYITTPTAVGQVVSVNVINLSASDNLCTQFTVVRAVVRKIGAKGIWIEDSTDAPGGYTDADYQNFSDLLDNQIYNLDVNTWGAPTDLDNNGKIIIVVSRQVNLGNPNVLGFVFSGDLISPTGGAVGCKSSNYGEVFYGKAPDSSYPRSEAILDADFVIAHEFTHIIQNGRRQVANQSDLTVWEREGQATISEALNGFQALGLQEHQNYGVDVAFQNFDTTKTAWFEDRFVDLADFYGFPNDTTATKVAGAPEQCTMIQPSLSSTLGPCLGGRQAYGNSSMLIQYSLDRFGSTYPGGETALLSQLIGSGLSGLGNISHVVGVSVDTLLSQYYASLYVDDRVAGANPLLTVNTWNLTNVFEGVSSSGSRLRTTTRLIPDSTGFVPYSQSVSVRGGSNDYLRVFGSNRPASALRVRSSDDVTPLPSTMRVWVVRLQ